MIDELPMRVAIAVAAAFGVAAIAIGWLRDSRWAQHALDRPNERSLHAQAVPRLGGIGIACGVAVAAAVLAPLLDHRLILALAGYALLGWVSWLDDVRGLPPLPRLVVHLAVAAAWSAAIGVPAAWLPVAAIAIGWAANLYNFMDGSDGMAAGMTVTGFGALGIGLAAAGALAAAGVALAIAAAALAFLGYNRAPASVFLGDSGSIPLGFAAAALGIHGWQIGAWSLAFPLLAFLPFCFDATVTLVARTLRGDKPWHAHRTHFYQKAVRSGLGHAGTAWRAWLLMLGCAGTAVAMRASPDVVQGLILLAGICVNAIVAVTIERRWRRFAP